MRKFTFLLAISLGFSLAGLRAQHILSYIDTEYPGADTTFFLEDAFTELDTSSYLTTAFLWDRTSPNLPLDLYNGSAFTEVSVDAQALMQGYLDVRGAAVQATNLPDYDSLVNLTQQLLVGYDALPITVLDFSLNRIKTNAFSQGLLTFTNGMLHADGTGSPFDEMEVFMAGMFNQTFPLNDTFNIVAPYILYYGTNGQSLNSIRINMNDGNGWQNLTWNQPMAFYLSGEEGEFDFEIEVTYADESTKISKNKGFKKSTGCTVIPPEEAPWGGETVTFRIPYHNGIGGTTQYANYTRYVHYHLTSTDLYRKKAYGKVYVRYRNGAPASQPKNFEKPVIVVEGIDFGQVLPDHTYQTITSFSNAIRLGSFGWPEMFGCSSDNYPNEKMPDFVNSLYNNDNDLIFLDFKNGADYIQRNALLLKELINRVSQYKTGDEEIVLIGVSMGGQVARYTLTQMEGNDEDHCVRLFVSHDSPWRGAHIAASLQFFGKYHAELHNSATAKEAIRQLNTPAAKQMLLYHYTNEGTSQNNFTSNKVRYYHWGYNGNGAHPLRQGFTSELAAMGDYPKKCRNVAVANGNSEGSQRYGLGATLYSLNSSCGGFDVRANLYNIGRSDNLVGDFNRDGSYRRMWFIYGVPSLSGVPGGYRDDLAELKNGIEDELPWYCSSITVPEALQEKFSFVPTISALNIANAPWDDKAIDYALPENSQEKGNTHFEVYHAPVNADEDHGQVTDENISWLMNQIRLGERKLESHNNGVLAKTWNNPTENAFIGSLDINSGGYLYLNAARPIYDYTDPYDPKPEEGSTSHVRIGGVCTSTKVINVNSGGKMILGDNNTEVNKAYLYVGDGAALNINDAGIVEIHEESKILVKDGGQVSINPNGSLKLVGDAQVVVESGGKLIINGGALEVIVDGRIIVEDGGELIYNQNSVLNLGNYGASLKIQGKLSVGNNANFTFTGNGRLVFDQSIPWLQNAQGYHYQELDKYWNIGDNASFTVEGSSTNPNYDHVLIEAHQPVSMKMEDATTFDQVSIKYGRVALHDGALFFVFSPVNLQFVKFNTAYSWQRHGGFRIFNNPGPNAINRCKFENGEVGALAQWTGGGPAVHFEQCEFTNNGTGLEVQGGNFSVSLGTFTNNGQGIKAEFLTGNSVITGTNVTRQNVNSRAGIGASSQTGAYVSVRNCDISNYKAALSFEHMNSRVECSQLKWNDIGISQINGFLDIGEEAGNIFLGSISADVSFGEDNGLGIGISLEDGYNDFAASGAMGPWYVNGFFENNVPSSVVGDNNKMPVYIDNGTTKLRVLIEDYTATPTGIVPFDLDPNKNLTSIPSFVCDGATHNPGLESAYVRYVGGVGPAGMVAGGSYHGEPVLDAALDALAGVSFGENIRQDDSALVKITDLLNAPIEEGNSNTVLVKKALYNQMHQALGNAYQYGYLTNVQNEAGQVNDTVMDVVNVIQSALAAVDLTDTNSYIEVYRYNLDKAFAYRASGHYDNAMTVFANSANWATTYEQTQKAGYWECVCTVEKDYFDGELSAEDYEHQLMDCRTQYAGFTTKSSLQRLRGTGSSYSSSWKPEYRMSSFPMPVQDDVTVNIEPAYYGEVRFSLTDLSGKLLDHGTWNWEGASHGYNVSRLATGTYLLQLQFGDVNKTVKLVRE